MDTNKKVETPSKVTVEDLQKQVRDHINADNFDWHEALTENEMIYLEQLLLTFAPMFSPGSIGFEKTVRPYLTSKVSEESANEGEKKKCAGSDIGIFEHNKSIFHLGQCHICYQSNVINQAASHTPVDAEGDAVNPIIIVDLLNNWSNDNNRETIPRKSFLEIAKLIIDKIKSD